MALNINQYGQTTVQGELDLQFNNQVIACRVSHSQSTPLIAGQAVKIEDSAGGTPAVLALAAVTDKTFGYVVRTLKDPNFAADKPLEIALGGSVMQMTANAAIARGANIEVVISNNTVITNAGTNPIAGWALDKAVNVGDLIRVYILKP